MPNPLLSLLPKNTGKRPQKEDMDVEPVPETYEGYNNPYRGTELHGVEPDTEPRPVPGHAEGRTVVYDEPLPEPEPIPVVIVNTGSRELRRSRIWRAKANAGQSNQIIGRDEARIKVRIKNLTVDVVYIGYTDATANANHSWPLAQNETFESETQDELWAMTSHATDPATLSVNVVYGAEL